MAERKRKPNSPDVVSRATHKYIRTHYDRIELQIPAGMKEKLKECAKQSGARSLQQWITTLLEKETGLDLVLKGEFGVAYTKQKSKDEGSAE